MLASICNLYKKVNVPDSTERATDLIWTRCRNNTHPYDIDELCIEIEDGDFMNLYFHEWLQRRATFEVRDFVSDLCNLGTTFEY